MSAAVIFYIAALSFLMANTCVYLATQKAYNRRDAFVEGWLFSVFAVIRYVRLPVRHWPAREDSGPSLATVETLCPICGKPITVGEPIEQEPTGRALHASCAELFLQSKKPRVTPKDPVPPELWGTQRLCRILILYVAVYSWLIAGFMSMRTSQIAEFQRTSYPNLEGPDTSLESAVAIGEISLVLAIAITICLAGFWIANERGLNRDLLCRWLFPCAATLSVLLIATVLMAIYLH